MGGSDADDHQHLSRSLADPNQDRAYEAAHMKVTALCFLMAMCAWGGFFYGNSFYMVALAKTHGWSVTQISAAISLGFWSCIPASIAVE